MAVSDTTGVDTVYLNWTANKVAQPSIVMTNTAGIYSGTIPASGTDAIAYDFKAFDNSSNHNVSTFAGGAYLDGQLQSVLRTSANGYIGVGGSYQLSAIVSNAKQVGTGTTLTTGLPNPYYTTWWGNREQYLIPASELLAGFLTQTYLSGDNDTNSELILGCYYRLNESVIAVVGYQIAKLKFVVSYDVTMSALTPANRSMGAFELGLVYQGLYHAPNGNRSEYGCPRF